MRPIIVIALVVVAGSCRKSEDSESLRKNVSRDVGALSEADAARGGDVPPTFEAALRASVRDFVALAERCDQGYFSVVEPERIKKWQLPVNVKAMEEECDALLSLCRDLLDRGVLRHPAMDRFLERAAALSDRYLLLCLRCKKVGVRDLLPYIREVSALRDTIREDVAALRNLTAEVLTLSDEDLQGIERIPPSDVPRFAHGVFLSLREDLRRLVEVPVRQGIPTPRYSLFLADRRAGRALTLLRSRAMVQGQALLGPAEALTRAFSAAVNFFTGDYFNADEKLPPQVIRAVVDADRRYRVAASRVIRQMGSQKEENDVIPTGYGRRPDRKSK